MGTSMVAYRDVDMHGAELPSELVAACRCGEWPTKLVLSWLVYRLTNLEAGDGVLRSDKPITIYLRLRYASETTPIFD